MFSASSQSMVVLPRPPVKEEADCFFLANFVMTPAHEKGTRGFADWIVPMIKQNGSQVENHLQYAFNACSMALLNNKGGSNNRLNEKALFEYTRALSATNAALRDPKTQMTDSTLGAVLLLGTYEVGPGTLGLMKHITDTYRLIEHNCEKDRHAIMGLAHRGCNADCQSSWEEAVARRGRALAVRQCTRHDGK